MGRKDAARFKKIEDRIEMLETNQDKIIEQQDSILKRWQRSIIMMRELIDKLIEGE